MKRKLSVLISAVFALSCAYVPNAIYAEDNETASMWKYASYSFGETPEEDISIGMTLINQDISLVPSTPSTENDNCSYTTNKTSDGIFCRTEKDGKPCAMATKYYAPKRAEGKRTVRGYMYFDAPYEFTPSDNKLTIEIEYFDEGEDDFRIGYVNGSGTSTGKRIISRTNTNEWLTKKITITDAYFNAFNEDGTPANTSMLKGASDFRIESLGVDTAIRKIAVYNGSDSVTGRSYKAVMANGGRADRTYFTKGMWTNDSKRVVVRSGGDGYLYEYTLSTNSFRLLVRSSRDFAVAPTNDLFYINGKTIRCMNLDTYEDRKITELPDTASSSAASIQVTNDAKNVTVLFYEDTQEDDYVTDADGNKTYYYRRLAVYDIEKGEWDLRYRHVFPDEQPALTHFIINPEYKNLLFFCHEGTTTQIPDRLWLLDRDSGEKKNMFIQHDNSLPEDNIVKTGETSGHENWTADGEHMVFVKYTKKNNVGMNGIVRIDKYGEKREYINDDYEYWHCHPSPDNRFITADVQPVNATKYTLSGVTGEVGVGMCDIVMVDAKNSTSKLVAQVRAGDTHPYQPHPAIAPNGRLLTYSCMDESNNLYIGIMDISDITAGKAGETFEHKTNEDKGMLVSEPVYDENGVSVTAEGTSINGKTIRLFGAKYDSNGALEKVSVSDEKTLARGESVTLSAEGVSTDWRLFIWRSDSNLPFSLSPSAPERLRVSERSAQSVELTWFAPTNLRTDGISYKIRRDGELIGTVNDPYFRDNSVEHNQTYQYTVNALYPQGTVSEAATVEYESYENDVVSIVFENPIIENGMKFVYNATNTASDSYTEVAEIGGRACRRTVASPYVNSSGNTVNKTGMFYFRPDERYISPSDHHVDITITYYDNGTAPIYLQYNAADGDIDKSVKIERTDSNTWVTKTISIEDASFVFPKALTYSAFRLNGGADTYIYEVMVSNKSWQNKNNYQSINCSALKSNGMTYIADGDVTVSDVNGTKCLYAPSGSYIGYNAADEYLYGNAKRGITIDIEYFDNGIGDIVLEYNTNDGTYSGDSAYKQKTIVQKTNSGEWKTARVILLDSCFRNMQSGGADFRIGGSDGVYAGNVKIVARPL